LPPGTRRHHVEFGLEDWPHLERVRLHREHWLESLEKRSLR
jgi:hypothetical protein